MLWLLITSPSFMANFISPFMRNLPCIKASCELSLPVIMLTKSPSFMVIVTPAGLLPLPTETDPLPF